MQKKVKRRFELKESVMQILAAINDNVVIKNPAVEKRIMFRTFFSTFSKEKTTNEH